MERELQGDDPTVCIVRDFVDAVTDGRPPIASGEQGLHILEATLAVYLSSATGETVGLPLPPDHPVAREGVVGLAQMTLPPWSPVSRRGMYGIRASEET